MPLLYSAPLASSLARSLAAPDSDTDVVDLQTTDGSGLNVGYSPVTFSRGFGGRMGFDGGSVTMTCVPNSTGSEEFGTRTELRFPKLTVPESGFTAYTIAFDFMHISVPVTDSSPGFSLCQMHCGIENTWLTWMLFETNGRLSVGIPTQYSSGVSSYVPVGGTPYRQGVWNRLTVRTWLAKDASGYLGMWLNGIKFVSMRGVTCHADTSVGPYFKLGAYNILRRTDANRVVGLRNLEIHTGITSDADIDFVNTLRGPVPLLRRSR